MMRGGRGRKFWKLLRVTWCFAEKKHNLTPSPLAGAGHMAQPTHQGGKERGHPEGAQRRGRAGWWAPKSSPWAANLGGHEGLGHQLSKPCQALGWQKFKQARFPLKEAFMVGTAPGKAEAERQGARKEVMIEREMQVKWGQTKERVGEGGSSTGRRRQTRLQGKV